MQFPQQYFPTWTIPTNKTSGTRIVLDGVRGAIFEYDAGNNLSGSWASSSGHDQYGHAYPAGFSINPGAPGTGVQVTFSATAPPSPNVGDIWGNTSLGNTFYQWSGSTWINYAWGTGAISSGAITTPLLAAGAVTAAKIAAGTIVAGIVDGTTITGAQLIATGTSGDILGYNGTPATGNLIFAVSPTTGSDSFGNSWPVGILTQQGSIAGNFWALLSSGSLSFGRYGGSSTATPGLFPIDDVTLQLMSGKHAGTFQSMFQIIPNNALGGGFLLANAGATPATTDYAEIQGSLAVIGLDSTGKVTISGGAINPLLTVTDTASAPSNPNIEIVNNASGDKGLGVRVSGDTQDRTLLKSDGSLWFGPGGSTAQDTNLYRGGANLLQTDDGFALSNKSAPAGVAGQTAIYSNQGQLAFVDDAGLALNVQGSATTNVAGTTVTTTTITSLGFLTVPGGDVNAGTAYKVHASGSFSTGTTPSNQRMLLFWGGTGGTIIAELDPPITAGLTGLGWYCDCEVNWITSTSCEVTMVVGWHNAAGSAGSIVQFVVILTTGLSTTGSNNLSLAWKWGSVPTGTSFVCDVIRFSKPTR